MTDPDLVSRIEAQFGPTTDRPDVWRALDRILPTSAYLNLGYSRWYQSHLVGNPQRRLVSRVFRELMAMEQHQPGMRVLDVGCGRGGAARQLMESSGLEVIGIDLVPYNAQQAVRQQSVNSQGVGFVVGDAARLPFVSGSLDSVISIDSIVYMPNKPGVFTELARVLDTGGTGVITDLVIDHAQPDEDSVSAFANTWGMAPLVTRKRYRSMLEDAGVVVESVTDISRSSVRRFKKWTRLFLGLVQTPLRALIARVLRRYHISLPALISQVSAAHKVLDSLHHLLIRFNTPP